MNRFTNPNGYQIQLKRGNCFLCGKSSFLIYSKYKKELYCTSCFIEKIEKTIYNTIIDYKMLFADDKVIVGLSGGKDSITLLYNLIKLSEKQFLKSISALVIDEGIKGYRDKSIEDALNFCKSYEIPVKILSFKERVGKSLDEINDYYNKKDGRKYSCNYCATIRRRLLNDGAKELEGTVLAVGHNLTDFTETFLMNIFYNRLPLIGRQYLFKEESGEIRKYYIKKVKPLIQIPEEEIFLYVNLKKLRYYPSHCPYRELDPILRKRVLFLIQKLKKINPKVEYNLFNSFNSLSEMLYEYYPEKIDNYCANCGYPAGSYQLCTYCSLIQDLKG